MSDRELAALFHALGKDLDARQSARIKQLQSVERNLFEALVKVLVEALDKGGGKITDRRGSVSIGRLVDQIFRSIERNELKDFYRQSVKDLGAILDNGALYAREVKPMKPSNFLAVRRTVNRTMRRQLGLDPKTNTIVADGLLDKLFTTEASRGKVKEIVYAGVTQGKPIAKVMLELEKAVKGTRQIGGLLEQQFTAFIGDTYQEFDRETSFQYAKRLKLADFIYQGGLVEDSREFCIKHDGKVYSVEEAERDFPKDPTLPRTTLERKTGVLVGYDPVRKLGRWRCRHRARYISPEHAEDRRKAN